MLGLVGASAAAAEGVDELAAEGGAREGGAERGGGAVVVEHNGGQVGGVVAVTRGHLSWLYSPHCPAACE